MHNDDHGHDHDHDHRHGAGEWRPPRWRNRVPTHQELLELSHRVYKHSRRLYSEADAQGLRVYHDERLDGSDGARGLCAQCVCAALFKRKGKRRAPVAAGSGGKLNLDCHNSPFTTTHTTHDASSLTRHTPTNNANKQTVRVTMLVPSWFPRPHVSFDAVLPRLDASRVSVVVVVRGTVRDLVGNTMANLQLLFNKLIDDQYLPDAATDATKVVQGWLLELIARHPELRPPGARRARGFGGPEWLPDGDGEGEGGNGGADGAEGGGGGGARRRLKLDVSITGHSLGGLIAEAATVDSARFAEAHGVAWRCVSFESPGLPEHYHRAAAAVRPGARAWDASITGYLAAPNPINMLYPHLGELSGQDRKRQASRRVLGGEARGGERIRSLRQLL